MPRNEPTLMPLLRALVAGQPGLSAGQLNEEQVSLAVAFGMGPLLRPAARDDLSVFPQCCRHLIVGSELVAETAATNREKALGQILDESRAQLGPITLLKGISVSEHYPEPHMRTMADLDLLVGAEDLRALERVLSNLGYLPETSDISDSFYRSHHHSRPLAHPDTGVRIEAHTGLLPSRVSIQSASALGAANVDAERLSSTFAGRPVLRFSNELQFLYVAANWLYGMNVPRARAAGGLIDTLYLLQETADETDWERLASWLHHREVATPLAVIFGYLRRSGLARPDAAFCAALDRAPTSVGALGTRTLYHIVDTCLGGGFSNRPATPAAIIWQTLSTPTRPVRNLFEVPFNLVFPPRTPGRFTPGLQLRRIKGLFGDSSPT